MVVVAGKNHLQIFQASVKSNGWTDRTPALQLFAHLDGEALNVALLMPEGERANWECLSQGLSDYYNSPGFATELEILAVRGFRDMGKRARDWMIRERFIAAQRSCGLRIHLNCVPPDTPIRDIVDRCRVWESHSKQKESGSGIGLDQDPLGRFGDSREPGCLRSDSQELMECPVVDLRVPVPVASVIPSDVGTQRKVGNGDSQLAPLEVISSLVTRLLRTAQEGQLADVKVPPEEGIIISRAIGGRRGKRSLSNGVGKGVFLMRTAGTWGEPVFAGAHFFSVLVAGLVGGYPRWPILGDTDWWNWNVVYSGKRVMVGDQGMTNHDCA